MPRSVRIRHDRGSLKLHLPNFFTKAPLDDIRKIMKLIKKHPYENEAAHETLDQFFPAWESDFKDCLNRAEVKQQEAEREVREAQSRLACLGTMPTEKAKDDLKIKEGSLKYAIDVVKRANAALQRCAKVITEYKALKAKI